MKCTITSLEEPFTPKEVVITLETREETQAFKHIVGCWNSREGCICLDEAKRLANEIFDSLIGFPI